MDSTDEMDEEDMEYVNEEMGLQEDGYFAGTDDGENNYDKAEGSWIGAPDKGSAITDEPRLKKDAGRSKLSRSASRQEDGEP